MKTIVTAAIVALGVAAPSFAQTQLERAVGAEAGQYTLSQLVELKAAASDDGGTERNLFFGNTRINFSASNIHNDKAAKVFERIAAEKNGTQ